MREPLLKNKKPKPKKKKELRKQAKERKKAGLKPLDEEAIAKLLLDHKFRASPPWDQLPIQCFWDIENCIPKKDLFDANNIIIDLTKSLRSLGYNGQVFVHVFSNWTGLEKSISKAISESLTMLDKDVNSRVKFTIVPSYKKEDVHEELERFAKAENEKEPYGNILLISGDGYFKPMISNFQEEEKSNTLVAFKPKTVNHGFLYSIRGVMMDFNKIFGQLKNK
ncbi:unnamed protein product [Cochlearia groenlandica]